MWALMETVWQSEAKIEEKDTKSEQFENKEFYWCNKTRWERTNRDAKREPKKNTPRETDETEQPKKTWQQEIKEEIDDFFGM